MAEHDDGPAVIGHFGAWIASADTKAALLAGGIAITAGAALDRSALRGVLDAEAPGRLIGLAIFAAVVLSLTLTVISLGLALIPRTASSGNGDNRFSFPQVARTEQLPPSDSHRDAEAWQQAKTLAIIAADKFRWIRYACIGFGASLALSIAWTITATVVGGSVGT